MENEFSRWKSDPYFSVAEDIQTSADRLESVFRTCQRMHANLPKDAGDSPDPHSNYQIELNAACDTLYWQVEEFAKEINFDKSDEPDKIGDHPRRLKFIHSIRHRVNAIRSQMKDSSLTFVPSIGTKSNLSSFLSSSISLESTSPRTGDKQTFENGLSGQPTLSHALRSRIPTHLESSLHPGLLNSDFEYQQAVLVDSCGVSTPLKHEDARGIHSPKFNDSHNLRPHLDHTQPEVVNDECKTNNPLASKESGYRRSNNRSDSLTKTKDLEITSSSQLWELIAPKFREKDTNKSVCGVEQSNDSPLDVETGSNLDFVSPRGNFESLDDETTNKELSNFQSRHLQWLIEPQLRLIRLRPLQIAACIFIVCSIAGFGHLYMQRNTEGSI